MSTILLLPIVYLAAVLEIWLAPHWQIRGAAPDLMALIALAWLARGRGEGGLIVVALVGLASDLGSVTPLGIGTAAFAVVGCAVIQVRRWMPLQWLPVQWIVIWWGTTIVALLQGATLRLTGQTSLLWRLVAERGALVGLYTAGVALPLLMIAGWIHESKRTDSLADALDSLPLAQENSLSDGYLHGSVRT